MWYTRTIGVVSCPLYIDILGFYQVNENKLKDDCNHKYIIEVNLSLQGEQSKIPDSLWEIIEAVSEGLSNKEIAAKLYISEGTLKNYISTILEKSNLSHRTQLAVYYLTGKRNR